VLIVTQLSDLLSEMTAYFVTYTQRFYRAQGEQPINDITPLMIEKINHLATLHSSSLPLITATREEIEKASHDVAYNLIDMLFRRDFSGDGKHWSFDGHYATRIPNPNNVAHMNTTTSPTLNGGEAIYQPEIEEIFEVSESYCWDWKDIYAVAESKGTVIINHEKKTIFVKEYSFYCSG
jgi:hypothetical protein